MLLGIGFVALGATEPTKAIPMLTEALAIH
jgi:hypothetical protein